MRRAARAGPRRGGVPARSVLRRPAARPAPAPRRGLRLRGKTRRSLSPKRRSNSPMRRPLSPKGSALSPKARCVTFRDTVHILEYTRQLGGGGGVPNDGSYVTLGLGKCAGTATEPLAEERPGKRKLDDDAPWLPSPRRARLLRASMGTVKYRRQSQAHLKEMKVLQLERRRALRDPVDWLPMPSSMKAARRRGAEVAKACAEPSPKVPPAGSS